MQFVCDCSLNRVSCQPLVCEKKEMNEQDHKAEIQRLNADTLRHLKSANRNIIITTVLIGIALIISIVKLSLP